MSPPATWTEAVLCGAPDLHGKPLTSWEPPTMTAPTVKFFDNLSRRGHEPLLEKVSAKVRFDITDGELTVDGDPELLVLAGRLFPGPPAGSSGREASARGRRSS